MKIDGLEIKYGYGGRAIVEVWAKLHTVDDVDDMVAWLQMAKGTMRQWEKIHARSAQKAKAPPSKNEDTQRREVQGAA